MVAMAIYSVTMVLWKETAFPLCRAMERRWKRNVVSRVSSVIVVIRLPISCVSSMAISCHVLAVSMADGWKMCGGQLGVFVCVVLRCLVGCCTWFSCVLPMWDSAYMSGTALLQLMLNSFV